MKLPPFRIEHYYAKYEFTAKYMLSNSDAQSRTIGDVLKLEDGAHEKFLEHWCGYTESPGLPELRTAAAAIYRGIAAEDVLVVSSAEEGILLTMHALLGAGDHAIIETPVYQSAVELARSSCADVDLWQRRWEDGWAHDLGALERMLRPETRLIYICSPANPLGLVTPREVYERVHAIGRERGIFVLTDEVYRELEHDPALRLPAGCETGERGISLGSMSKTYGLPGLRLGWLATRDREAGKKLLALRYYTSICNSAPSEFLSAVALRHREVLVRENLAIVKANLPRLERFFGEFGDWFQWTRPNGSPVGLARMRDGVDPQEFCEDLVAKKSTLLLPGSMFDEPRFVRFGYGRRNMPEALGLLEEYLRER